MRSWRTWASAFAWHAGFRPLVARTGEMPVAMPEVSGSLLEKVPLPDGRPAPVRAGEGRVADRRFLPSTCSRETARSRSRRFASPLLHRQGDEKYVVCVSSQVGCPMGCAFCATGRMGFRRDLAAWEMVDQVVKDP